MKCQGNAFEIAEFPPCGSQATHYACEPFIGAKVCEEHRRRCKRFADPISVVDARVAAVMAETPSSWMAL